MKEIKDVHGSKAASAPLIIGLSTVYVHTNVREVPLTDPEGNVIEGHFEYVYDEVQYDKDEYIKLMSERSDVLEEQSNINRSDIDFLMLLNDAL